MGEARRKKLAGNTESNPRYKRNKKITRKEMNEMMPQSAEGILALVSAMSMYKRGIGGLVKTRNREE